MSQAGASSTASVEVPAPPCAPATTISGSGGRQGGTRPPGRGGAVIGCTRSLPRFPGAALRGRRMMPAVTSSTRIITLD